MAPLWSQTPKIIVLIFIACAFTDIAFFPTSFLRAISRQRFPGLAGTHRPGALSSDQYGALLDAEYMAAASPTHRTLLRENRDAHEEEDHPAGQDGAASNLTAAALTVVRLWFQHNATVPRAWPEQRRECAPGCTRLGNCNAQSGECECPYGRAGPACETLLAPACRWSSQLLALDARRRWPSAAGRRSCSCSCTDAAAPRQRCRGAGRASSPAAAHAPAG
jgi:hypothetical protein